MSETITIALGFEPLDVLFFRDGKPFEAGIRASTIEPLPQTLAGAIRTHALQAAGCDFDRLGADIGNGNGFAEALKLQSPPLAAAAELICRGPWFAQDGAPLLPMPASLHRPKRADGGFIRLDPWPASPPGWRAPMPGMRPLLATSRERIERAEGWLTLQGIHAFLQGNVPKQDQSVARDALFDIDSRTGIVIEPETWTTKESLIYLADYLALKPGVSLYAEITGPAACLDQAFPPGGTLTLPLGGQGRRVCVTRGAPVAWPERPSGAGKRLLLLTCPALFNGGWHPQRLSPVAAAVPGHVAFSGWDLARRGPKPTRFAAAAGSVFFFDTPPHIDRHSLCDDADDRLIGWGSYLEGIW
ncbi:MAG: type III-B CRISPR module-associated Cmr3 family protein [Acetobacteraceae bacterium]